MEIIGTGYGKEIQIGESYIQESVVNMWDSVPKDVFEYYSKGFRMTLRLVTKTSENGYSHKNLLKTDITEKITEALNKKGDYLIYK